MMPYYYILEADGTVRSTTSIEEWSTFFQSKDRTIAYDSFRLDKVNEVIHKLDTGEQGAIVVSTVFLAVGHSFGESEPVLFETRIFGGKNNEYQTRYTTKKAALEGHQEAVNLVKEELGLRR